ncbi:MAG: arsenate reductase ArsC [Leptospirales bacterium]|nr:arsenate reductase ArsC [Leptospirales bacterium]
MEKLTILFLCTGNSCRSQMAEAVVKTLHQDRFIGYSAGSEPDLGKFPETKGVHPMALRVLQENRIWTEGLYSKSWDQFIQQKERIDFAFTLCDNAQTEMLEVCPVFPGQPMTAHWGLPDPALATGSDEVVRKVFQDAFFLLKRRLDLLASLPFASLQQNALQNRVDEIGKVDAANGAISG